MERKPRSGSNVDVKERSVSTRPRSDVASRRSKSAARHISQLFTITRQGAVATGRRAAGTKAASPARTAIALIAGSTLIGLGVTFFVRARLGLPPYDVLLSAVAAGWDITHGQAAWAISGLLLVVASILGRRPSRWSLAMVFTNGAAVDFFAHLIVGPEGLAARWSFAVLGFLSIVSGVALVVHSGATGGPFELLMGAGEDRGLSPIATRTTLEVGVVAAGVLGGGIFGPATLLFALSTGVALRVILQALTDHRSGRESRLVPDAPHRVGDVST